MTNFELEPVLTVIIPEENYAERFAKFAVESRKLWENAIDNTMAEPVGVN